MVVIACNVCEQERYYGIAFFDHLPYTAFAL